MLTACISASGMIASAHESDTLFCHLYNAPGLVLYPSSQGYFSGNNEFNILEVAQKYGQAPVGDTTSSECEVPPGHQLNEVVVRFGAKTVLNPNDSVYVRVYAMDPGSGSPGTLLGTSFATPLNWVDTSSTQEVYSNFLMQLPVSFTDSFFVSVVLPAGTGNLAGIMTNSNGDGLGARLCHVKDSSGSWVSMQDFSLLDIDAAIFPVIGEATSNIPEMCVPYIQVNVFPNPGTSSVTFDLTLTGPSENCILTVKNINGKIMLQTHTGKMRGGKYPVSIQTATWPAGLYFYSLQTGNQVSTGKLQINR